MSRMIDMYGLKGGLVARFSLGLVALAVAATLVSMWLHRGTADGVPAARPPCEYRVMQLRREDDHDAVQSILNARGGDGWEFAGVATEEGARGSYMVLRRSGGGAR